MAESALITITDVQTYRRVDPKFDSNRFAVFEQETRRKNLKGLLGDALYYAFMADSRNAGIYAELLNGKSYSYNAQTIQYYGLKPMLCYWWLTIAARESEMFQANIGAIQLVNNTQQMFETAKEKERIAAGYMETAQGYANDLIKFLNTNAATYPLWEGKGEKNPVNFVSFRV